MPPKTSDAGTAACGVESMPDVGIRPLGNGVGRNTIARGLPTTERQQDISYLFIHGYFPIPLALGICCYQQVA